LRACNDDLTAVVASAKGKKAAAVSTQAQPLVDSCRKASAAFEAYLEQR
jgi:hypothetical protein